MLSINPANGENIANYGEISQEEMMEIAKKVSEAQKAWKKTSFAQRRQSMNRMSALLRERSEALAHLMSQEMGKVITAGEAEVEKCAWACEFFAEHAEAFLQPEIIPSDAYKSFVTFQPTGVILAIMPWNFPLWQVFRCIAPALMAGNGVVLKHASNVQGCAIAIEDIVKESGFPENIFRNIPVSGAKISPVIESPYISGVALTGSTEAGKQIAAKAGANLKKTVLELGGSDPYIVLEDADLEFAATTCVNSRLINSGQSCIAAKRFIVVKPIKQEFENLVVEKMRRIKVGDPLDRSTQLGPMARADLRDELHQQVLRSIESGAKLCLGGQITKGTGCYYPPTVLSDVKKGMSAYDEELFGPVAVIIEAEDQDDAIRIANDTCFGLGAAVFTRDIRLGERLAEEEIESGVCVVNSFVKSDPRLPFGGIKESGYGRELASIGIKEFVNIKTVYIGH